jgi:hypothetical protein
LTCARHQFLPRSLQPSNSRCPNSFYTPSFSLSLSLSQNNDKSQKTTRLAQILNNRATSWW